MTNFEVVKQGDPVVNGIENNPILHEDIAFLRFDMKTKRCEVFTYSDSLPGEEFGEDGCVFNGTPNLVLSTTEGTPGSGKIDNFTTISLPGFVGWEIAMAECVRYTLSILLVKKRKRL